MPVVTKDRQECLSYLLRVDQTEQFLSQVCIDGFEDIVLYQGRFAIAQGEISQRQIVVRRSEVGLQASGLLEGLNSLLNSIQLKVRLTQIVAGLCFAGFQHPQLIESAGSFLEAA